MRASRIATAMLAALLLGTAGAAAAVNVTFVKPEKYRDDDFRNASKREGVIRELTRHFERLDKRYLTAGEKLEITVLDARLAGRYERWQPTFNDVRILRDTTPPRFVIRYTLRQNGKIIASAICGAPLHAILPNGSPMKRTCCATGSESASSS
jgi:hypothetical protein